MSFTRRSPMGESRQEEYRVVWPCSFNRTALAVQLPPPTGGDFWRNLMQDGPHDSEDGGRRGLARLQIENSVVWAATIIGVAVAAKASTNFI
jgi:hypothetical protein